MDPDISIVVPSRGRADKLRCLLDRLSRQSTAPGMAFEVLVALDGQPTDQPAARPDGLGLPVRWIPLPQMGISAAKNAAVAEARGRILLFLNDDVEPAPDFVHQHAVAQSAGHPIVLGAAPLKRFADQTVFDEAVARTRMIFFYGELKAGERPDFRHAWNLNLSVDRALIDRTTGPFAESLRPFMYEDLELAYRLLGPEQGVFYHPSARAVHNHRYDLAGYLEREAMLGVMAGELYAVNPDCAAAIFGRSLDEVVGQARGVLPVDARDGSRCLSTLAELARQPWLTEGIGVDLRLFYLAHLPLKRRAFRAGLLAAADRPQTPWTERVGLAAGALARDPVFSNLESRG